MKYFIAIVVMILTAAITSANEAQLFDGHCSFDGGGGDASFRGVGLLNDGHRIGEWVFFYASGKPYMIRHYSDKGLLQGQHIEYYENGKLAVLGNFTDGHESGYWFGWFETGNVRYIGYYDGGLPYFQWYDDAGKPKNGGLDAIFNGKVEILKASVIATNNPSPSVQAMDFSKWSSAHGSDQYGSWADLVLNGITQRFRLIHPGTFIMGSPPDEKGRGDFETPHSVVITRGYWMADSDCTQALWLAMMGANPSYFKGDLIPVDSVSFDDCVQFLKVVNGRVQGLGARLPTEAEWEYACRAGTSTPYAGPNLNDLGWYYGNNHDKPHEVRMKLPNAWGLYDMHCDVSQWCQDWYGEYPTNSVSDPEGPLAGFLKVLRGGGWLSSQDECRSAFRHAAVPSMHSEQVGFRIVIPSDQP